MGPLIFDTFVRWLHTQEFPSTHVEWAAMLKAVDKKSFLPSEDEYDDEDAAIIVNAYVLGDRFLAAKFKLPCWINSSNT